MAIQNGDLYVLQQGETKYNVTYEQLRSAILSGTSTPLIQPDVPSADVSNVGQFWWDSDIGQLYIYYQDPSGDKYWVNASTPGIPNAAQVTVSTTPPLSPQPGNLWWKDDAGVLYVYYLDPTGDQYWVDTNPAGNPLEDATLQLVTDNGNFTTQSVNIGNTETAPNIQLKSDGSSQFNDDLVVFDPTTSENVVLRSTGAVVVSTDDDSSSNNVWQHKYGSITKSSITAAGGATFSGNVSSNTLDVYRADGTTSVLSCSGAGNVVIGQNSTIIANDQGITIDTDGIVLNADGSATFKELVSAGSGQYTNVCFSGTNRGDVPAGDNAVFFGQTANASGIIFGGGISGVGDTYNFTLLADGSASFSGDVTASNITAFKAALTSAVTSATDVATLKSAILSAIASL